MIEKIIRLPDIGEGIAESEISEWRVAPGDLVVEDDPLVVLLTDKAAVEIPSSLSGKVTWLAAEAGTVLPVGAPLLKIEVAGDEQGGEPDASGEDSEAPQEAPPAPTPPEKPDAAPPASAPGKAPRAASDARPLAAPAVRKRASDLGIDLAGLTGSGPEGRITHADLDHHLAGGPGRRASDEVTETPVIGLRRKIAEQMARAHASIPAITIVEEVDVTELERLRGQMNGTRRADQPKLTLLPFLIRAMDLARTVAPQVNAHYDDAQNIVNQFAAAHVGVATQTDKGLLVPVLRHAEMRTVWDMATEIARLATGARVGKLSRDELSGSSMTITSLGALGAFASTPIINHPEVAVVGVNRKATRPHWDGTSFVPREMMNLSASFDHRIVDGWDAARFIARMKELLETPALLFATIENESRRCR